MGQRSIRIFLLLIVSAATVPNLTTDFAGAKFFRVNVGVSRSIADGANEFVKVAGRKSLRILGKDLCRSNGSGNRTSPTDRLGADEATAAGAEPGENGRIVQKFVTLPQQRRHGLGWQDLDKARVNLCSTAVQ